MENHRRAHEDQELWQSLRPGQEIVVVKLDPEGHEAARYPAAVVARATDEDWVALQATWTYRRVEVDGLVFHPGDELIEWFSPTLPFNAFGVLSPAGDLRGWYANVTYPAYLEPDSETENLLKLVWHDLYLDLVGMPDETYVVRDEDELAASGLEASNLALHSDIVAAADDLILRYRTLQLPFVLPNAASSAISDPRQSQNESV